MQQSIAHLLKVPCGSLEPDKNSDDKISNPFGALLEIFASDVPAMLCQRRRVCLQASSRNKDSDALLVPLSLGWPESISAWMASWLSWRALQRPLRATDVSSSKPLLACLLTEVELWARRGASPKEDTCIGHFVAVLKENVCVGLCFRKRVLEL